MTDFAARVEQVSISGIREVFEAAGDDAINLGLGQPDFPTPAHARRGAIEAIEAGRADAYTSNKGTPQLREAISAKYDRDYDLEIDPEDVIATSGGSEALHLALEAHVDPGEEVIFPDPGFVSYDALTHIASGTPKPVGLRDDLTLDPATVEDAITPETAAFVVNSPANPTGAVQSEADMREFARIADEHDVLCISDEVYEHIVFEGDHHSPLEFAETDNVLAISACSKTYSMTGWRLGWVVASNRRIERMLRVHQYGQACASAPAQYAAEGSPDGAPGSGTGDGRHLRAAAGPRAGRAHRRRPRGADPEGAFYAMPKVPDGWCEEVLERGVVVVPGDAFGANGEGYARLSYATGTEELKEALEIMDDATRAVR